MRTLFAAGCAVFSFPRRIPRPGACFSSARKRTPIHAPWKAVRPSISSTLRTGRRPLDRGRRVTRVPGPGRAERRRPAEALREADRRRGGSSRRPRSESSHAARRGRRGREAQAHRVESQSGHVHHPQLHAGRARGGAREAPASTAAGRRRARTSVSLASASVRTWARALSPLVVWGEASASPRCSGSSASQRARSG